MDTYKILLIDDDADQKEQLGETVREINSEKIFSKKISFEVATSAKEAAYFLYTDKFDGLIVDLKLNEGEEVETDEQLSGNVLLTEILKKEIIPVIVRTGTPDRFTNEFEETNKIIKVYAKDEKSFYDHIDELIKISKSSTFKMFGSEGEIKKSIDELFWRVIPDCFSSWGDELNLMMEDKDKVLIRYISNWLINKYNYSNGGFDNQDPLEMYMFPNNIEQVCTGDIFEKNTEYYIVLTPSCDLANRKTDNVLLTKIIPHNSVKAFFSHVESVNDSGVDNLSARKCNTLSRWFRNGELSRYHFLPRVSFFEGGFIDFQQIVTVPYNSETKSLSDESLKKLGILTDSFVKDVISRFVSYYQRQGQPEFNVNRVITYLLDKENI